MQLTDYHAKYFAHELTKRCASASIEKLAGALVDAQVDLNPHQIDAALFAFKSPLSKGALLADEVGLGKTIEAGLVISQRWAERRRRIAVGTIGSNRSSTMSRGSAIPLTRDEAGIACGAGPDRPSLTLTSGASPPVASGKPTSMQPGNDVNAQTRAKPDTSRRNIQPLLIK